jgi:hypothetical protein
MFLQQLFLKSLEQPFISQGQFEHLQTLRGYLIIFKKKKTYLSGKIYLY